MAHAAQWEYLQAVKLRFPGYFHDANVLSIGARDVNATARGINPVILFEGCEHTGIDVAAGPGVDVVASARQFADRFLSPPYDVVYACDVLEHDREYPTTLCAMVRLCKPGGLILWTCATAGRPEHGTNRTNPRDAPRAGNYYENLTEDDIRRVWDADHIFSWYEFSVHRGHCDLRFVGVRAHGVDLQDGAP
jgi:hypothetical protein